MLETSRFNWQGWEADIETASGQDAGSASYLNQALYSSFSFLPLLWHRSGKIKPSPIMSRLLGGGDHPDCWICQQGFSSAHTETLCFSPGIVSLLLQMSLHTTTDHPEVSRQVPLLQPEQPVPCFCLSLIITLYPIRNIYVNLSTFALPCSHDYLDQMCSYSLRDLTSSTHLCKII